MNVFKEWLTFLLVSFRANRCYIPMGVLTAILVFNFGFRDRSNSSPASPMTRPMGSLGQETFTNSSPIHTAKPSADSPPPPPSRRSTSGQRPLSLVQPMMGGPLIDTTRTKDVEQTQPELVRIFKYLGAHNQKVYHEGYFQKLNDLNPGEFCKLYVDIISNQNSI